MLTFPGEHVGFHESVGLCSNYILPCPLDRLTFRGKITMRLLMPGACDGRVLRVCPPYRFEVPITSPVVFFSKRGSIHVLLDMSHGPRSLSATTSTPASRRPCEFYRGTAGNILSLVSKGVPVFPSCRGTSGIPFRVYILA